MAIAVGIPACLRCLLQSEAGVWCHSSSAAERTLGQLLIWKITPLSSVELLWFMLMRVWLTVLSALQNSFLPSLETGERSSTTGISDAFFICNGYLVKLSQTRHLFLGKEMPKQTINNISSSNTENNALKELPDNGCTVEGNFWD